MEKKEFDKIIDFLKGNFKYAEFLSEQMSLSMLFNQCNRFPYQVVEKAATELVMNGAYDSEGKRIPFSIETFVHTMERKNAELRDTKTKPDSDFYCPKCRNSGWIQWEDVEQRCYAKPCTCKIGRYTAPWYFTEQTTK